MNSLNIKMEYKRHIPFSVPVTNLALGRHRNCPETNLWLDTPFLRRHGRLVHFEFFHPQASRVNIAGPFNDWRPEATWMISLGHGRWIKQLVLPPGRYQYCLVVDGHWIATRGNTQATDGAPRHCHPAFVVPSSRRNGHSRPLILSASLESGPASTVLPVSIP